MNKGIEFFKTIMVLIGILLMTLVAGIVGGLLFDINDPGFGLYTAFLGQLVILVCTLLLVKNKRKKHGKNYVVNQGIKNDSWKMLFIGFGLAGFGNILISLLMKAFSDTQMVNQSIDIINMALTATTPFQWVILILLVAIVAPIGEELLFRGYLFAETHRLYPLVATVILNGLIFGLYHLNFLQGVNTFIMGMVLALVFYHRQNITDAILVHFANNLIAILSMIFADYASIIGIFLIACIFIGGFFFYQTIKNSQAEKSELREIDQNLTIEEKEDKSVTIYE